MTSPVSPVSAEVVALEMLRDWFEAQRKAISKGCGSTWDMHQCYDKIQFINETLATAPSGAKVPGFIVQAAERAIHEAKHPVGMHTNGPSMAMMEVSKLAMLLRYALAAAPLPPDPTVNECICK